MPRLLKKLFETLKILRSPRSYDKKEKKAEGEVSTAHLKSALTPVPSSHRKNSWGMLN